VRRLKEELTRDGYVSKARRAGSKHTGGKPFVRGALYTILKNPVYIGKVAHKGKLHKGKHEPLLDPGLWKDVQERLAANRHRKRTRANARTPSLLAGLLFDDRGNPMSPTQSHRGSRRYRYYISQALLQYREHEAGSVARVPADSLETLVSDQWLAFLGDGARLLDAIGADGWPASDQHALLDQAKALATGWSDGTMPQRIAQLQQWRPRITIGRDALRIELPGESVRTVWGARMTAAATRSPAPIEWTVPVALKRSGIETKLVIPSGPPPLAHTASATALREAVEKALTWNQALLADPTKSTCSLAKAEGVTQRFIAQRLQLAWLAPDIVQRIIAGDIPDTLTLEHFKKRRIPLDWAEQRAFFQIT